MFPNPATNFEPSLPGNSFSDPAYLVDLEKAALVFLILALLTALMRRSAAVNTGRFAPAVFGAGVISVAAVLAFGLDWLTP